MIDDLWALGLANLCRLAEYDAEVPEAARLMGRDLDTWRAILAIALWLEEGYRVDGLFKRMEQLSLNYQTDRTEFEMSDSTRLALLALWNLLMTEGKQAMEVETSKVNNEINRLALEADLSTQSEDFTNAKKTGRQLRRLRFKKAPAGKTRRRWRISRKEVEASAGTYGIALDPENNADNAEMQGRFAASRVV